MISTLPTDLPFMPARVSMTRSSNLTDLTGASPDLNSSNNFNRINPVVGATYKITPEISAYASYSEANRAPTPLELGCCEPDKRLA